MGTRSASRRRLLIQTALASGIGAAACAAQAIAQSAPPAAPAAAASAQVDEVKVTARHREEKAQDVPLPISVVTPKTAVRERLERLDEYAQKIPNFKPNINNPRTSGTAIRGVAGGTGGGSGGADGSESAVGYIVDDVFYTHVGFQWADFLDIQSFEVARGPQGTLLGKNTTVGAAIIRTAPPSFTRSAWIESSFGNYDRVTEKVSITGPIIDDKLAYRISGYFDKGDGWVRDQVSGAGYLNNDRWGVRGQLLYVGDNFTDRFIFDRLGSHEYNNSGAGVIGNSVPLFANGTIANSYIVTLANRLGRRPLTFDPYKRYQTRVGTLDQRTIGASNKFDWQIGDYTLTGIHAWREFILHPRNGLGDNLTSITSNAYDVTVDQYSQELRLASPVGEKFDWQLGSYTLYERVWSLNHFDFGSDAARWFNAPTIVNGFQAHKDGKANTFSTALFGQGTYHYDEQWALTFGLRDTYEIKQGSVFAWNGAWGNQDPIATYRAMTTNGGFGAYDTGGQTRYNNSLSGLFNPSYRYNENVMVYGSVARGEKSGAVNTDALAIFDSNFQFKGFQNLFTKPEVSWDYELGTKTNWLDGRLVANLNVYWNDIYNYQIQLANTDFTDANGVVLRKNYLGNIPHVRLRGAEFDAKYSPIERLWLTTAVAYTDARYISFDNAPPPADWTWPRPAGAPPNFINAPATLSRSNTRFENLPIWTANFGANYEHPLGNAFAALGRWADQPVTAFGYVNVNLRSKTQLTNPWSLFQYWQKAFPLVNLGFGVRTDDERYQLQFWAKNVFDERFFTSWSPGTATAPATIGLPAQPRIYGGSLTVKLY